MRQRLGDLDELLRGNGERVHHGGGVDVEPQRYQQLIGLPVEPLEIDETVPPRFRAEEDVFGNGQERYRAQFLLDDGDAGVQRLLGVGEAAGLAVDEDFAVIRLDESHQDIEQRRLAGAVAAAQRMDLAPLQLQGAIDQGMHARKAFFDATHGKQGRQH